MKRYALFAGDTYYPAGGWGDFEGSFDTPEQAKQAAEALGHGDWWHVIDLQTGEFVLEN